MGDDRIVTKYKNTEKLNYMRKVASATFLTMDFYKERSSHNIFKLVVNHIL